MDDNFVETEPVDTPAAETEPKPKPLKLEPSEAKAELDTDLKISDEDVQMTSVPDTLDGYVPAEKDAKIVSQLFDDVTADSFRELSDKYGFSLGFHQRLISFLLKASKAGITDDAVMLSRFKVFGEKERMSQNIFDVLVKFQIDAAKKYQKGIERIQVNSARASGKPNKNAHELYILTNSHAANDKLHKNHTATVKKLLELCGVPKRR